MKNTTLIMLTFLMSTNIFAQIKTGGGPDHPVEDDPLWGVYKVEENIKEYVAHLKEQDAKCSKNKKIDKNADFMQIYLKLSLIKNTKHPADQCDEVNRYLSCLEDHTAKKMAKHLAKESESKAYIAGKYIINQSEAEKMLKFFSDLGEKVE